MEVLNVNSKAGLIVLLNRRSGDRNIDGIAGLT